MPATTAEIAEKAAWGRARAATVLASTFIAAQAGSFGDDLPLNRPQALHLSAWVVWAAMLMFFLVTGGNIFRSKRLRAILNDESTQDHRRRAMALGFWGTIGAAMFLYVASFYEPLSARLALRLVITVGIAVALLRFSVLERKALKNG